MKLFYIVIISLFCNKIKCQNYSSRWFDTDNALPENSIKDIIKDKYGFIWLSTESGIVRYDGNSFLTYNDRLKKKNYHMMYFTGDIRKDSILICNDNEEDYVLIKKRIPNILDKKQKIPTTIFVRNNLEYQQIFKNIPLNRKTYHNNYFLRLGSQIYYFNTHSVEYGKNYQAKKIPILFAEEYLNHIFVQEKILFVPDFISRKMIRIANGVPVHIDADPLYTDPESKVYWHQTTGQVFIVNKGDLYKSQVVDGKLKLIHLLHYNELKKLSIYSIYFDETFNKIYFGTVNKGLNVISISNFKISKRKENNIYYSILPNSKNSVITPNGEVFNSKSSAGNIYHFKEDYENISMTRDDEGNLYCINNFTLNKLFKSTGYKTRSTLDFYKRVHWISRDRDLYFLGLFDLKTPHLYVFKNKILGTPNYKFNFPANVNIAIRYDNERLLVGSSQGLYIVSLRYRTIEKVGNDDINIKDLIRTSKGYFWITTHGNGLYFYQNKKLIKMPADINKHILSAHTILEDHEGSYWIPTNNGLFTVKEDLLLKYVLNQKTRVSYYRFVKQDGLHTNEFNGSSKPSGATVGNGNLVFPSMDGLLFFDPKSIKTYYPNPNNMYIERVKINDIEEINFNKTLVLENSSVHAEIYFDIGYYANEDNLDIEAKIDGYSGWTKVGKERSFIIKHINPGNYTLAIRVLTSPYGKYSYQTIKINVGYLFYQTLTFKIVIIIIILSVIFYIIRMRTKFVRIKNTFLKEKLSLQNIELNRTLNHLTITREELKNELDYRLKLLESINHDISTPIKYLSILSQKLLEAENIEKQKDHLSTLHKFSEQLYNYTLTLRDYGELYRNNNIYEEKKHCLNSLLEEKQELFKGFALLNNTKIHNEIEENIFICVKKEIISVVLHNVLDNAVKCTKNGNIFIKTHCEKDLISIQISDTGIGMSKKQIEYYNHTYQNSDDRTITFEQKGLGLHMIIQLIKKIEGKITFSNNNPVGTIVTVIFKN